MSSLLFFKSFKNIPNILFFTDLPSSKAKPTSSFLNSSCFTNFIIPSIPPISSSKCIVKVILDHLYLCYSRKTKSISQTEKPTHN